MKFPEGQSPSKLPEGLTTFFSLSPSGAYQARLTSPIKCKKLEYILSLLGRSYRTQIINTRHSGLQYRITLYGP